MKASLGKFKGNGKYGLVAEWLYENSLDGLDEQLGESNDFGWYGKWSDKIKGRGPFYAILSENVLGFFDVDWFDSQEELDKAWKKLEAHYDKFIMEGVYNYEN